MGYQVTSSDVKANVDTTQMYRNYEIATNYGTVQGRVVFIGFDFLELVDSTLSTVVVPYKNIVSISTV